MCPGGTGGPEEDPEQTPGFKVRRLWPVTLMFMV